MSLDSTLLSKVSRKIYNTFNKIISLIYLLRMKLAIIALAVVALAAVASAQGGGVELGEPHCQ